MIGREQKWITWRGRRRGQELGFLHFIGGGVTILGNADGCYHSR